MSRAHRSFTALAIALIAAGFIIGFAVLLKANSGSTDYEAIIDDAIRTSNPLLCEDVRETTRPGPTDGKVKITGQEAIDWCKQQVNAGQRILGG